MGKKLSFQKDPNSAILAKIKKNQKKGRTKKGRTEKKGRTTGEQQ